MQRGVVRVTAAVTIVNVSAVNTGKSMLSLLGVSGTNTGGPMYEDSMPYLELISATQIRITRVSNTSGPYVSWQLAEFI